jgi:protein-tyrosine phosphatase
VHLVSSVITADEESKPLPSALASTLAQTTSQGEPLFHAPAPAALWPIQVRTTQGARKTFTVAALSQPQQRQWQRALSSCVRFCESPLNEARLPPVAARALPMQMSLTDEPSVANNGDDSESDSEEQEDAPSPIEPVAQPKGKSTSFIKARVSKKKRRYVQDGFDLDLTYITPRVIAMGFPSTGREAFYRNDMGDVVRFFETRHANHYKIYNLCSERLYAKAAFARSMHFPFDDHAPCAFADVLHLVRDVARFLRSSDQNVVGLHCKAGKGRTGMFASMLIMYLTTCNQAASALRYYGNIRTTNGKGVTIASQIRWVYMFQSLLAHAGAKASKADKADKKAESAGPKVQLPELRPLRLSRVHVCGPAPAFDSLLVQNNGHDHVFKLSDLKAQGALHSFAHPADQPHVHACTRPHGHTAACAYTLEHARELTQRIAPDCGVPGDGQERGSECCMKGTELALHLPSRRLRRFVETGAVPEGDDGEGVWVEGDVLVEARKHGIFGGKRTTWRCWLHTQFVDAGGLRVLMRKPHLDKANKKKGLADFAVELVFEA